MEDSNRKYKCLDRTLKTSAEISNNFYKYLNKNKNKKEFIILDTIEEDEFFKLNVDDLGGKWRKAGFNL